MGVADLEEEKMKDLSRRLVDANNIEFVSKSYSNLELFLEEYQINYDFSKYKLTINQHIAFFPIFLQEHEESFIQVYVFKKPIKDKNRRLKYIIVTGYNPNDQSVYDFYGFIKQLFDPNELRKLIDMKTEEK